jgi:hypothetical protein
MHWQVKYALANINTGDGRSSAVHVQNDIVSITTEEQPDVSAAISGASLITYELAKQYVQENPDIDFLCGYKKECV